MVLEISLQISTIGSLKKSNQQREERKNKAAYDLQVKKRGSNEKIKRIMIALRNSVLCLEDSD